jgi:hypothetical protein
MNVLRTALVSMLVVGLNTSAFAGDLAASIARAAEEQAQQQQPAGDTGSGAMKGLGAAIFAGGLAMMLYGFLASQEFGTEDVEKLARGRTGVGIAGAGVAAAGGALMIAADRRGNATALRVGGGGVTLAQRVTW